MRYIQASCSDVSAVTLRQMKYRTCKGAKRRTEEIVFPGYVFIKAPPRDDLIYNMPRQDLIRILTTENGRWQLIGQDRQFVKWLFQYDGLLDFSKAYREGDRIRIVSGPLKDMEGKITRVDKRGRSGQVLLSFNGKDVPVWLGFELINTV